jgi:hypothetical protein
MTAIAAFVALAAAAFQVGAILQARTQQAPVAREIAPSVAAALSTEGVRVEVPKGAALDFWWVKSLPLNGAAATAPSWSTVEEGTLVGAVRVSANIPDIRGKIIKPGVYTLRYGIQPANGDHLGVSAYPDFLLLSPAALDGDPAPKGHDGTVELSKNTIGGSHPAVWSIDPPSAGPKDAPLQTRTNDLMHQAVIIELPVSRAGAPAGTLKFGLVLVGKIEA